jgi:hypothetical protein
MFAQLAPAELQRCHWYANVIGLSPLQEPLDAVRVCPSWAVPEIVGRDVFVGGVAAVAAAATPASPSTARRAHATRPARMGGFFRVAADRKRRRL